MQRSWLVNNELVSAITRMYKTLYILVGWKLSAHRWWLAVEVHGFTYKRLKKKEDEHWGGRILAERARTVLVRTSQETNHTSYVNRKKTLKNY